MTRPARRSALLVLVLALATVPAVPAAANSYSVKDGHDIANPSALDILAARVGHKDGKLLHALVFERSVTPSSLRRIGGFVVFMLSTDDDGDIERRVYVLGGRRFRVYATNGSGRNVLARGRPYHPNARTLGAIFSAGVLNADGYEWYSAAVTDGPGDCCVDFAHDKYFSIHDLTPPEIDSLTFGDGPTTAVAGTLPAVTVPVTWHATDTGFGGLAHWTLRGRLDGIDGWTDMASGTFGTRNRKFDITTTTNTAAWAQGVNAEVCVSLDDWAGNRTTSGRYHFSVPYDDSNVGPGGVFSYSAGWTLAAQEDADYFLGTRSSTSISNETVTILVPAGLQHSLVVPGGVTGTASVTVNAVAADPISLSTTDDRSLIEITDGSWNASGTDTIVLTLTSGELEIDGYLGAPTYAGGTPYGNCGGRPTSALFAERLLAAGATAPTRLGRTARAPSR